MKYFLSIITCLLMILAFGQSPTTLEKVEAAKIALITERLELTPDQAEKFWPIYREFAEKQRSLRQEFQQLRTSHDPKTASDEENKKVLEQGMQIKERQLNLERNYSDRMQQVITTRQMMSLRKAEDDFRQMLIQRVRDQQQQRDQMHNDRMRDDQNNRQRNDQPHFEREGRH